jgi:serine/threonine protein kinase
MGLSPREAELRAARRALAEKLIAAPMLSEALLEHGRGPSLIDVLVKRGAPKDKLVALRAAAEASATDDIDEKPTKEDPRVNQIVLAVKCDQRLEKSRFMTTYMGRLPRDPEPAELLLISTDALRNGLWMDFLETVRAEKGISSPGLVPVLDAGRVEGNFAIVTRHRAGSLTLRALLERVRRLKLSEALRITREAAQGLTDLHAAKLAHRDVRPENIVLGKDGVTKLRRAGVVFEPDGVAQRGSVFGTIHHMAPECLRGEPTDPLSDVYALGVCTYEMVTGVRPFEGDTLADLKAQHLDQPVLRPDKFIPDVPDTVGDLLTWMLSKKSKDRPPAAKLVSVIKTLENNIHRSGTTTRMQAFKE